MTENRSAYDPARHLIQREAAKGLRRLQLLTRRWLPPVVSSHIFGGSVLSGAGIFAAVTGRLPALIVVGFCVFALSAVVVLLGTQSVMRGERLRRAQAEIRESRARERELELEDALDLVELYAGGDRTARQAIFRHPKARRVASALRTLERRAVEHGRANPERPKPARAAIRGDAAAPAKPYDTSQVKRRRASREQELNVVRAEVQALAALDDKGVQQMLQEARAEARAARDRVWEADRMIRERQRRRQAPLPNDPGPQREITLRVAPLHDQQVKTSVTASPEMVANGEVVEPG